MEDIDIYELASSVISGITRDLNESTYTKLGGELTIVWCSEKNFGAYASSLSEVGKPPKHRVTMRYELARQVWRDAEDLCEFLQGIPENSSVDKLFDGFEDRTRLPKCVNDEVLVKNIFVAAITWVYFHEIGHLMQEHGVIRAEFGQHYSPAEQTTYVHDFEATNDNRLTGPEALVSHVTELAADFEATYFFVSELVRHVTEPDFVDDKERTEVLSDLIYLMVCGLSLLFFRFNGSQPILPAATVEGSHPNPLFRLEFNLPQIFESLDMMRKVEDHGLERNQLILLCTKAALSVTLYWSMTKTATQEFDDRFLLKGLLANSVILQYLQPIVKCWDEIRPRVNQIRRFGAPLGLMTFTDSFKARIADLIPWGHGPEREIKAASSP